MGKISYGLYMYHPVAIFIAISLAMAMDIRASWFHYALSLALSVALAGLSYRYFESAFLRMKAGFTRLPNNARMTDGAP
ncbi:MAG: hypothetical protein HRU51_04690 [Xanthomonadales bacterium]|nr:hypothetical protein [Xanthomonadales bacterium]